MSSPCSLCNTYSLDCNSFLATAAGIEPAFSAPVTDSRLEDDLGYAAILLEAGDGNRTHSAFRHQGMSLISARCLSPHKLL